MGSQKQNSNVNSSTQFAQCVQDFLLISFVIIIIDDLQSFFLKRGKDWRKKANVMEWMTHKHLETNMHFCKK